MPPPPRLRFEGQEHWIRPETRWRPEVLRLRDVPVVALDLSGSPLTYDGLDNLGEPWDPLGPPHNPLGTPP